VLVPGAWLAEWSRKHPIRRRVGVRTAAMTVSKVGLLSQMIERGAGADSYHKSERARGLVILPSS
jgi:hypothetical protein